MSSLAILGAGGHGRVVADIAKDIGWSEITFFDDFSSEKKNGLWSVAGNQEALIQGLGDFNGVIVAIGDNHRRLEKVKLLKGLGAPLVNIIHPSAVISQEAHIGFGSVVMPQVSVNYGACIGVGNILNTACNVEHDCLLSDGVHVSPGVNIAGEVKVGINSWLGIGSSVLQQVSIGANAIVGAGAVVISDVADHSTVVGVPAKAIL